MLEVTAFFCVLGTVFCGLIAAAILTRIAYAISEKITEAPLLDAFVSLFTWVPWAVGATWDGWRGFFAASSPSFFSSISSAWFTAPSAAKRVVPSPMPKPCAGTDPQSGVPFAPDPGRARLRGDPCHGTRPLPHCGRHRKTPTYKQSEWVNLSRHKYDGLVGYDLLWCWYCDWMTGLWSLGSEMLRNIESFWCPIRFRSDAKNRNASIDFPDVKEWAPADGSLEDAVRLIEKHYDGKRKNSWWGHPDRSKES